jgi:hypothetical protein
MIDNVGAGLSVNVAESKNHQIKTCPSTESIDLWIFFGLIRPRGIHRSPLGASINIDRWVDFTWAVVNLWGEYAGIL